ncbi:hypothetical protein KUM42_03980 [Modestobacter sp. L9-4]|uniref:hypothetical protein n=1 Tax=Modestobacter sp. L9-4 TaxID=2851567 RepID=UPI001C78E555|nr:hypothetical protein [Modestobacter sp. L9-4]QXG76719.1 hypothetical protein KUM42_03980 [Modestobacter sp. L9-4]
MPTSNSLVTLLEQLPGVSQVDATSDRVNSIGNTVVRCVYDGRRAVAVGADGRTEIDALLDLVDLHLHGAGVVGDTAVVADEVVLLLVQDAWDTEAEGALRTLAAELRAPVRVLLRRLNSRGDLLPISASGLDDIGDHEKYRYTEWLRYLMDLGDRPPTLVNRVLAGVTRPEFRAYPMLTRKNWWSLRLEGLEVAQVGAQQGRVDVGQDYDGRRGPERAAWLTAVPEGRLDITDDDSSVARAAGAINAFADAWDGEVPATGKHNEHVLESRILRGIVPVRTSEGALTLLRSPEEQRVSWGSQFPTRWGLTKSNSGRYLDVLLRDGRTPWALELKVDGSAGVAGYYRHGVKQAVLYRHFIRHATYLAPWFERFGLDHAACRAAVVVPEFQPDQERWRDRLQRVCDAFDVELITVPEHFARQGTMR